MVGRPGTRPSSVRVEQRVGNSGTGGDLGCTAIPRLASGSSPQCLPCQVGADCAAAAARPGDGGRPAIAALQGGGHSSGPTGVSLRRSCRPASRRLRPCAPQARPRSQGGCGETSWARGRRGAATAAIEAAASRGGSAGRRRATAGGCPAGSSGCREGARSGGWCSSSAWDIAAGDTGLQAPVVAVAAVAAGLVVPRAVPLYCGIAGRPRYLLPALVCQPHTPTHHWSGRRCT